MRPDKIDEYVEAHRSVWPEMVAALREAGIRNYTIFATATRCSGTSRRTTSSRRPLMEEQEVNSRWQDAMAELLEERVPDAGPPMLEEVFRLD